MGEAPRLVRTRYSGGRVVHFGRAFSAPIAPTHETMVASGGDWGMRR